MMLGPVPAQLRSGDASPQWARPSTPDKPEYDVLNCAGAHAAIVRLDESTARCRHASEMPGKMVYDKAARYRGPPAKLQSARARGQDRARQDEGFSPVGVRRQCAEIFVVE